MKVKSSKRAAPPPGPPPVESSTEDPELNSVPSSMESSMDGQMPKMAVPAGDMLIVFEPPLSPVSPAKQQEPELVVRDQATLVDIMNERVQGIRLKYKNKHEALRQAEKEEIANFYTSVHAKMQRDPTWCAIN